jgi:hypothetical protein
MLITLKEKINWKYFWAVVLVTLLFVSLGYIRYLQGRRILNENLHRNIVVVDKDCGNTKYKNRLYFYNGYDKQHLTVRNYDCDQINLGDTISALYDQYNDLFFYKEIDFLNDIYGTFGFAAIGGILLLTVLFDFRINKG